MEMTHKLESARLQHPALLLPCCWSRFLTHHLRWAGSGHAPALCLLLAPMARCWFFTTDNNHVSKALVKVGSRAPPPCWGRTSRRDSPMRSAGCTVCLACIPWVLQLPEPGSGEQLEEAPWGCPPVLPVLPPSTTACASTQCWPLLPCLTSEQTNGFSCSEAEVYPKCGRAETGTEEAGQGAGLAWGLQWDLRSQAVRVPALTSLSLALSGHQGPCPTGRCPVRAGGSRVPPQSPSPRVQFEAPGKHRPAAAGLNPPQARPQSTHAVRGLYFCSSVFIY